VARSFFVTGTDTGVGKTLVACGLLNAFAGSGRSVIGMKPVAAGSEAGRWADVDALTGASNIKAQPALINPYAFDPPLAPHIAAGLAGVEIKLEVITRAHEALSRLADCVVVEGIGGFLVPLNARETSADLAIRLGFPVVLVVGMRLGCLNHALLTRGQIEQSRLRCAGWVANCIHPDMPYLAENIKALVERLECPLLGVVPYCAQPCGADIAPRLSVEALA